jgi:hypothetical protein
MGLSTDAKFFFGYCWQDDGEPARLHELSDAYNEGTGEGWEGVIAEAAGHPPPTEPYDSNGPGNEAWNKWWGLRNKAVKKTGCKVGFHCSADYPMYYVAIEASEVVAPRGCPQPVLGLNEYPEWRGMLDDFCRTLGVEPPTDGPCWWLASDMG